MAGKLIRSGAVSRIAGRLSHGEQGARTSHWIVVPNVVWARVTCAERHVCFSYAIHTMAGTMTAGSLLIKGNP